MKLTILFILSVILWSSCTIAQDHSKPMLKGGPCEGCEAILEFGDQELNSIDTLPAFHKEGLKINIKGTIYHKDGTTPAENVILYFYHTNQEGIYAYKGEAKGWAKQHGYNRGWVKTNENGQYAFYTIKPAPYPNRSGPAHIHYTILEPNGKYYWLESCHFEGDSLLTNKEINPDKPRGGYSGLLRLKKEEGLWVGTRDIILGENIPDYD